ncbi:MAG: queuosine precursor transporter [Chlamydiia bacterium]|nr:queuosine precursor transporter [Chlamydiia bacterium]
MLNEIFFFIQILLVIGFSVGAVRLGSQALVALVALNGVLANLFVVKQMDLFGLTVTCSDVFAVGSILGLNLLQEYFGKEAAQRAVKISFFSLLFFVAVSQIHLWYVPASTDQAHSAFAAILVSTPRIVAASVFVYFLVQKLDVSLFGWMKRRFEGRLLVFRMGISLVLTQFIDTVLFSFLGLYGIVSSMMAVIGVSFIVKCCVIFCSAPLAALSRRIFINPRGQ